MRLTINKHPNRISRKSAVLNANKTFFFMTPPQKNLCADFIINKRFFPKHRSAAILPRVVPGDGGKGSFSVMGDKKQNPRLKYQLDLLE
jgi:hypothetical protein